MMEEIKQLREKIRELSDVLDFMQKYQVKFNLNSYESLYAQLRNWKLELIELEFEQSKMIRKQIISN